MTPPLLSFICLGTSRLYELAMAGARCAATDCCKFCNPRLTETHVTCHPEWVTNRFHTVYLREELARRCDFNPRYSLRAFARSLGTDPGTLSRVLTCRRPLTLKSALGMLKGL